MKYLSGAIVVFFLCLFAFTKWVGPIPLSISSVTTQKTDTFSVSGEGKVTVIPDIAVVGVGVTAQAPTARAAQNELNTKMNAVSDAIKNTGVDANDIQTTNYNLSPTYNYSEGSQQITGYQANSNLTIKVRKMDNANAVIDAATKNGANIVGGITFDVADKSAYEQKARTLAVTDAKNKAEAAAKTAGFHLGRIINYSEGGNPSPRPVMYTNEALPASGGGAPTRVQPGSSELTVDVTLSYEIN